jgi:hypothetical protein
MRKLVTVSRDVLTRRNIQQNKHGALNAMFTCSTLVSEKLPHDNGVTWIQAFEYRDEFIPFIESRELRAEGHVL